MKLKVKESKFLQNSAKLSKTQQLMNFKRTTIEISRVELNLESEKVHNSAKSSINVR